MKKGTKMLAVLLVFALPFILWAFTKKDELKPDLTTIHIKRGMISGVSNNAGDVTAFKGIPYADPPVGDLRWKAPQPVKSWQGVKKCDQFGPSPMQPKPIPFAVYTSEFLIPEAPISEDCLYLNVWTNAKQQNDKKPVLVWIYGGGFMSGGTACPIYDGEALAKKDVIFVSVNYRVGAFGFLAHPELSKESGGKGSGNYGLLDQIAALQWVKENIASFGGDPDNVTIAGQSAGSMSVNCLVISPLAKGLFKRAIAESGSFFWKGGDISIPTLLAAEASGKDITDKAEIHTIAEMRKMSSEDVLKKVRGRFTPVVDAYVLTAAPADSYARNKQNHVPLLIGWNGDESFDPGNRKKEIYVQQAQKTYGDKAAEFLKYFPGETDEQASKSEMELGLYNTFALSQYTWAITQSQFDDSPVYLYNFNRKVPASGDFVKYGAFHTGEVAYVFNNLKFLNNRPFTETDNALAELMSNYWVNFIKTGNPNGSSVPEWPKFDINKNLVKVFDATSQTREVPSKDKLNFMLSTVVK